MRTLECPTTINEQVRSFITSTFYVPEPLRLQEDVSLLDMGIIDSVGVLEVIVFLESEFGIKVADVEIVPENLDSIASIAAFVERKHRA